MTDRFQTDFYRCPNTGEWVYRWKDERTVVIDSADLRALKESQAEVARLREALAAASNDRYEKGRLAFEMHHEMTYHEMCDVITKLRADWNDEHDIAQELAREVLDLQAEVVRLREALTVLTAAARLIRPAINGGFVTGDAVQAFDAAVAAASDGEADK